ncbi:MAG: hypothetical protein B7Y37_01695 [Sphingobacteriia bacterium 28-36-52]|nr:MAG: hypothetical protein B7Y37_01695 [Sphingobacteriia bacterium 28-36-52]
MGGISSKGAGKLENKFKFNEGTELTSDLGVEWYETAFRSYDAQIGRFIRIDDIADDFEFFSPYIFANNNPILLNDEFGLAADTIFVTSKEVVVEGVRKKSNITIPVNLSGHSIKSNPHFNPFDYRDDNNAPYINYEKTNPYAWNENILNASISTTSKAAIVIPLGRSLKWLRTILRLSKLNNNIPEAAKRVVDYAHRKNGAAQPSHIGGRIYKNDGRGGGERLPQITENGKQITYKEYDVHQRLDGFNRGNERVVVGSDGKSYYTNNHYHSFKEIKMK